MNPEEIKKLIENNASYWEKRSLGSELFLTENEIDYNKRLESIYTKGAKELEEKLSSSFVRYGKNNNLTTEQAKQILTNDMDKLYKNDLQDYIEKAKSGDPKYYKYLLNQSIMTHHTALDQLQTEFREVVQNLDKDGTMEKFLGKNYQNANYYNSFQYGNVFAKVSQESIQNLLDENWSGGGNFSQNIWKNKEQLVSALDDILINGLATGEGYDSMAKKLSERMQSSYKAARRLVMTESARLQNKGLFEQYKDLGVDQYQIVATLDLKTSEICQHMDGQIFNMDQGQVGLNLPPFHPYCRTTIAPYYGKDLITERAWRDKDTGKTVVNGDYSKYEDYLAKHLGNEEQAKALASSKNTLANLISAIPYTPTVAIAATGSTTTSLTLTTTEESALRRYAAADYEEINYNLRNDIELTDKQKEIFENLNSALPKLEVYDEWVKRTMNIDLDNIDAFLKEHSIGNIVEYKSFTSTDTHDLFNYRANIRMQILSKDGRLLGDYNKMEHEVLFKPNSKFQIVDLDIDVENNIYYIIMEEVL